MGRAAGKNGKVEPRMNTDCLRMIDNHPCGFLSLGVENAGLMRFRWQSSTATRTFIIAIRHTL